MNAEYIVPAGNWPADELEKVSACPVCAAPERMLMFDNLQDRIFFSAPGRWTMFRCQGCGSGYLDPRPTPETIGRVYANYYTHEQRSPPVAELSSFLKLRRTLANGYKNWRFGTKLEPASTAGVLAARLRPRMRRVLDRQFRHLPRGSVGRVLDIGCGDGGFLRNAEAMGWEAVGTDLDPVVVAKGRAAGLDVRLGTLEAVDGPFDVITLSHAIEHLHEPAKVLEACYELLREGGRLWVETPSMDAWGLTRFGPDWRGLEPPRHLVLFSRKALLELLSSLGFTDLRDLPQNSSAAGLYEISERIQRRGDPELPLPRSLRSRIEAKVGNIIERIRPERREYLAIVATKAPRQ
ncbi:class I SAM-dependent methyltransferase [Sphingomonas mesophila]|uniref:class I SAM-dependent methyltransferase n=1 Tax=Sphingomonas mesophila TaxID=2303576 RepID=UPI000E5693B8|nr:class I SAM-dependent methyltransferase [Sphingomonas mesophila]